MLSQIFEPLLKTPKSFLAIYVFSGVMVLIFSLNGVLKKISGVFSDTPFGDALYSLSNIPDSLYGALPVSQYFLFEILIRWLIFSIAIFISLLLLNAFYSKSVAMFVTGISGLTLGSLIFTLFSWIYGVISFIFWILSYVWYVVSVIASAIYSFLSWWPIAYTVLGLLGVVLTGVFIFAIIESWEEILNFLLATFLPMRAVICVLLLSIYLIAIIWEGYVKPLIAFIQFIVINYLAPILNWIFGVLLLIIGFLFLVAAIFLTLLLMGYYFCEQFITSKNCGRTTHGAFDAGFGLGVAIALILLICSVNSEYQVLLTEAWNASTPFFIVNPAVSFHALMYGEAKVLLQSLFIKSSLPIFDAVSLVIAFFIANCSVFMGLVSGSVKQPLKDLFKKERVPALLRVMASALAVITISILGAVSSEDV